MYVHINTSSPLKSPMHHWCYARIYFLHTTVNFAWSSVQWHPAMFHEQTAPGRLRTLKLTFEFYHTWGLNIGHLTTWIFCLFMKTHNVFSTVDNQHGKVLQTTRDSVNWHTKCGACVYVYTYLLQYICGSSLNIFVLLIYLDGSNW